MRRKICSSYGGNGVAWAIKCSCCSSQQQPDQENDSLNEPQYITCDKWKRLTQGHEAEALLQRQRPHNQVAQRVDNDLRVGMHAQASLHLLKCVIKHGHAAHGSWQRQRGGPGDEHQCEACTAPLYLCPCHPGSSQSSPVALFACRCGTCRPA